MSLPTEDFSIGVEEEYQIIDPKTREVRSRVQQILPLAQKALGELVQPEVQQSQIEIAAECGVDAERTFPIASAGLVAIAIKLDFFTQSKERSPLL